jgi:hypothetical protein
MPNESEFAVASRRQRRLRVVTLVAAIAVAFTNLPAGWAETDPGDPSCYLVNTCDYQGTSCTSEDLCNAYIPSGCAKDHYQLMACTDVTCDDHPRWHCYYHAA